MIKPALILPKNGVVIDSLKKSEHLYFLGGPIRGGNDWQAKAIKLLTEKDPACYIACPCRYNHEHELFKYSLPATKLPSETDDERELPEYVLSFENQTLWERYYLKKASHLGSIIFWLPCEDKENPRKKEDGPYARDTYGELGRWSILSSQDPSIKFSIGAETDFPGLSVIQKNFNADHQLSFKIWSSLEETIDNAIILANR